MAKHQAMAQATKTRQVLMSEHAQRRYTCYWSDDHQPAKPLVAIKQDSRRYVHVHELLPEKRQQFMAGAEQLNPAYHELANDEVVNAILNKFGGSLVIQEAAFDRAMQVTK